MKPTLFGYGLTTKAIADKLGGGCTFFDDKCTTTYTDEAGNTIYPSSEFNPNKSNLEVTTPSLPPKHPLIQSAKHLQSEYDYFLGRSEELGSRNDTELGRNEELGSRSEKTRSTQEQTSSTSPITPHSSLLTPHSPLLTPTSYLLPPTSPLPFTIWISGTNGKTTTTQMLTHLLEHKGAVAGGNIGTPLAALNEDAPIWVLETSSFTLHHTHRASPDIYLLLPITPDHLDWHGSKEAYEADKLRPLRTMREGELALVPKGLNLPQTDAYVVEYESNDFLCNYFDLDATKLNYKGAFLQDALLSLAITKVLFDETDYTLLNTFTRDAHRQEEFYDAQGRLWVNDSKATNLDATLQAIKTYQDSPLHLIMGGDDKGVDLTSLFEALQGLNLTLYSVGKNQETLLALSKQYHIKSTPAHTIENAVTLVAKAHTKESIALLSPAAASLDQFSSYKQRGEVFMQNVKRL